MQKRQENMTGLFFSENGGKEGSRGDLSRLMMKQTGDRRMRSFSRREGIADSKLSSVIDVTSTL